MLRASASRKSLGITLGAGLLALVIGAALALRYHETSAPTPRSADALFERTFEDADGRPQAVRQWQGSVLVVNFWATWCAPCVEEMPELQAVQSEYEKRGVVIIGLAIDGAPAVKQFRDQLQLRLPLLVAGADGSDLGRQLGNALGALPYTVLIDQSGQIVRAKLGRLHATELRTWLDAQLAKVG